MESQPEISLIYKVVGADLWSAAVERGEFNGAEIDLSDGFIHFSCPSQVKETVAKHFAGRHGLLLVAVDSEVLGDSMRLEKSRGGELFPHLYGTLDPECVDSVVDLPIGKDGNHIFPDEIV